MTQPLLTVAPRRLETVVQRLMSEEPVVALTGARTVGKSTLLRQLAKAYQQTIVDLDDPATRAVVADDLGFHVGGPSPG